MQKLLKLSEVCEELGLHKKTVLGYIKQGKIQAVKFGGRIRISREELERVKSKGVK